MQSTIHVYEVRPRKDKRGADLISDVLPFKTGFCIRQYCHSDPAVAGEALRLTYIACELTKAGRRALAAASRLHDAPYHDGQR
jgi:hypothetical protein